MTKISLCIPTKNRFDSFLDKNLDYYIDYLKKNIIDEIVITDEGGSDDYKKINDKYKDYLEKNDNFKIYKNEICLGVFLNKLKVCSLASHNFIALIDSDNFTDENYFFTVKNYIHEKDIKEDGHVLLCPCFAKPNFNYQFFQGNIITKNNIKQYLNQQNFQVLLNTGNFVFTKKMATNLQFDIKVLFNISACDVIYFNLQCFQQFEFLQLHVVPNLEYEHIVHNDSEYIKTHQNCDYFRDHIVIPMYYQL